MILVLEKNSHARAPVMAKLARESFMWQQFYNVDVKTTHNQKTELVRIVGEPEPVSLFRNGLTRIAGFQYHV